MHPWLCNRPKKIVSATCLDLCVPSNNLREDRQDWCWSRVTSIGADRVSAQFGADRARLICDQHNWPLTHHYLADQLLSLVKYSHQLMPIILINPMSIILINCYPLSSILISSRQLFWSAAVSRWSVSICYYQASVFCRCHSLKNFKSAVLV